MCQYDKVKSSFLREVLERIIFMISVDEFDDHFVFQYTDEGPRARFDAQFQKLISCIPSTIPVQLISATDPKALKNMGNEDPVVEAFSQLMDEKYFPVVIDIPSRLYAKYIPTAKVETIRINDANVFFLAWAVSVEMALTFDRIFEETGYLVSRDDVLSKLEAILLHTVSFVRLASGTLFLYKLSILVIFFSL